MVAPDEKFCKFAPESTYNSPYAVYNIYVHDFLTFGHDLRYLYMSCPIKVFRKCKAPHYIKCVK